MIKSWLYLSEHSNFPLENLPFGIFKTQNITPRVGVAVGEYVIDMQQLAENGILEDWHFDTNVFAQPYLNDFMGLGKEAHRQLRALLQSLFSENNVSLRHIISPALVLQTAVEMLMPVRIGDYTDFYSSEEHATNVGKMFRDANNALLPNWKQMPIAYHGRSSSIVVSGTDLHRPKGQMRPNDQEPPIFGASKALDFELEMAFIIGKNSTLGDTISVQEAEDYIFGFVLFNDWSARDIQKWEYQPLGPFLCKNFGSSIAAWVVSLEALEAFRTASPPQAPTPLPYLQSTGNHTFDIQLEVCIKTENGQESRITLSNFKYLYWNICQQLAHHTINGCNLNIGDMLASGTISGSTPDSFGSLLELTWGGKNPITLADGAERKYLQDGDTVIMRGWCQNENLRIGFGEVVGKVLPSK